MDGIITDDERRLIQHALREKLGATWKQVSSENSRDGKESYFWIRVEGRHQIRKVARDCLDVMAAFISDFGGVEFNVSFLQVKATSVTTWDQLDDGEIRAGGSGRALGLRPHMSERRDYTVFDRDI